MATAAERAQAHYTRWLQLGTGPTRRLRWTDRGIAFEATDPYLTPDGGGIGVTITASDANGPLPVDNPYQFFNPPLGIVVQDEVGSWVEVGDPPVLTWVVTVPRIIDTSEVISAAKAMVYDAVTLRARQLGWNG
jgi:hypothetical protein